MRNLHEIIVHCSDTRSNWMEGRSAGDKVGEIRRWHVEERKFSDIGYHFCIDRDGTVVRARPLSKQGAHVLGHNQGTVAICLIGGHGSAASDAFADNFTSEQASALRTLIGRLQRDYPDIKKVSGHNDFAAKACPGFNVDRWLNAVTERRTPAQSKTVQMSTAQMFTGVTGGVTAIAALDGTAQIVAIGAAIVVVVAAAIIMKERLKKWAAGQR